MDLPFLTAELPGTGGRLRATDDDFVVEEVPAYVPLGVGDHTYLRVEKRGIPTHEATVRIARALGRRPRDIGYAGLKDAHAVAVQTFSVEHVAPDQARAALVGVPGVRVLSAELHRNKLRLGHLRGNRFRVRVRDVVPDAATRARAVLDVLAARGSPNWFGEQRFGARGDNDVVGRQIVRGEVQPADLRQPRPILRLLVSAYQSALFNRLLSQRLATYATLETGDLAFLHANGAVFRVEDAAREQPRADAFEISPSGPLFGTKTLLADGAPGERERALLAEEEIDPARFDVPGLGEFDGERRPYRVPLRDVEVADAPSDPGDAGPSILVSFELPRGAYATTVLREVMK